MAVDFPTLAVVLLMNSPNCTVGVVLAERKKSKPALDEHLSTSRSALPGVPARLTQQVMVRALLRLALLFSLAGLPQLT